MAFYNNPNITDMGVVVLADGLLKALQTSLISLELCDVGMGDEGNLRQLGLRGVGSDNDICQDAVMGILEAAGRAGEIRVR